MRVPGEEDWGDYHSDLDREYAHRVFAGRTSEEVQPLFYQCVIERSDVLRWMPKIPFRYYMLSFRDYVMAGNFPDIEGSDAASCFLGLAEEKLEKQPDHILSIMPELLPALRHVARNQSLYDADEDIYGSFPEKLARIEVRYALLGADLQ